MSSQIVIAAAGIEVKGTLNDSLTAAKIREALPITARANLWGDEIYFTVPVRTSLEDGRETVEVGDLAYWPEGPALCIFMGKTPISRGDEIRPASAVTIVGRIPEVRKLPGKVKQGDKITIRR
jgi:hypothetical protein